MENQRYIRVIAFLIALLSTSAFTYTMVRIIEKIYKETSTAEYTKTKNHILDDPSVYCLMITGKDSDRSYFAQISVNNFNRQTYKNKHLVVVNHGNIPVIDAQSPDNISEIFVPRDTTLGRMRNMSLERVPEGAIWTTWDDDDWRSDDYIQTLYNELRAHPTKMYLMYCNRLEHNFNTDFSYNVSIPSGTYIFFAIKCPNIKYAEIMVKEDSPVKRFMYNNMDKTVIYKTNDPLLYIRFVHKNNTSLYIDYSKTEIVTNNQGVVFENNVNTQQENYINSIKKMYYK
jgi:hypothetical protein